MQTYLVIDMSNILYRSFYGYRANEDAETIMGLAVYNSFTMLNKYFKMFKPHKLVLAFDRSNWRKDYTKSDACISKKIYKGDRRQKQTPAEQVKYREFMKHVAEFEQMVTRFTSAICLAADKLEADDLIGAFVDMHPDDKITIISRDSDYIQLMDHPWVTLFNPFTDKQITLEEWEGDIEYHMFLKCIRGGEDNIQSAFPNVREKKLKEAWNDPFKMTNLMETEWKLKDDVTVKVADIYKENQLLMDLRKQPEDIQLLAINTVLEAKKSTNKFSMFDFRQYCGKHDLKIILDQMDNLIPMLSR